MTPRQRMLTAIGHGIPDRVPVAPDFSNMIPCRLTGKPFMHIYAEGDPPLWRAYLDAVQYFGIDGWFGSYGASPRVYAEHPTCDSTSRWLRQDTASWLQETVIRTPKGEMRTVTIFPHDQPPAPIERLIKNPEEDLPKLYCLWEEMDGVDYRHLDEQRQAIGELGAFGACIGTPGFHGWEGMFQGGVETLSLLYMDNPELLDELCERHHARIMRELPLYLAYQPDFLLTGGSGSITMASPTLWRKYALPTLQEICRQAKAAGVLTMVHSCGKERYLVETCANETDLDCVNPLEIAPMGDCDLREIKQAFGHKLSLMGNLHTTDLMLNGTVEEVKAAARQAIDDAAEGGGFILSTGDQCGRDTPDANIFALIEVAEEYGRY
ncbi:MAG: uroporphyrinogen decarboxylase family protein [Armatimonadota bacterium]